MAQLQILLIKISLLYFMGLLFQALQNGWLYRRIDQCAEYFNDGLSKGISQDTVIGEDPCESSFQKEEGKTGSFRCMKIEKS